MKTPSKKSAKDQTDRDGPTTPSLPLILETCALLPQLGGDRAALHKAIAQGAQKILAGELAGVFTRHGDTLLETTVAEGEPGLRSALASHAKAFAAEAMEKNKPLDFKFSYKGGEEAGVYFGLAFPLVTPNLAAALLVLRTTAFSSVESSALGTLGSVAKLVMEKTELAGVNAAQSRQMEQLLEISKDLGSMSRLDTFIGRFLVRTAEFMGYERAFVAVLEADHCKLRWGAAKGQHRRMEIELDCASVRRLIESKEPQVLEGPALPGQADQEQKLREEHHVRQYLGVPLLANDGRVLGILGLLDKKSQSKTGADDIRRAVALSAEVAIALESTNNLQLSELHRKRAENLMEMALDLGSALRLPDFVKNFTARVAHIMQAKHTVLALAQENKLETVGFHGLKPEREMQRRLNNAISEFATKHPDMKITGSGLQALGKEVGEDFGWSNLTVARLEGREGDLLGVLCLANIESELSPNDVNLLQALIGHASVALENSRLFTRITQSSRQWAEIFDSISDFIVVHDDQHRVLRVNRSLAELIGVRPAELIGLSMRALIPITSETAQSCPFCRAEDDPDEYLHPVLERTYLVSSSRIHGALNEGLQTVHVLKDITDRREAERRYRELFDNVQEGVFFASPEGGFIEVNDALVRMLGYAGREEVLKLDLTTQVYVSEQQRQEIARQLNDHGAVRNFEVALCRRDGTLIHALENAFVVRDAQDKVLQYRGVFLDITDVKNVQAQLQRERDFTSKILNNTQTMIMVADTAGLISYANRRCYEAGGFDQQALVGNRLDQIISSSHKKVFREAFESSLHGLQTDNLELVMVRSNGTHGRFSVNLSPMRDEGEDVTSIVVLMTDITDAAMIQAKLMHTEKMAAVGQLVSGVAHEVNNPLTAIMGFSDLLMENPEIPESARKDLKVILEEAQRTKEIVQNLLSFARQRPPQRHPLQVNDIVRKTIALRAYDFSNHGIQIVEKFDERLPELVADSHQMQQVFLNILNNAYDAVQATGRPGRIEIQTFQDEGWAEVMFRDNGEGIKHPERIFDPFFTTKEVGQGTGLGLSICYGIIREHDGEILCANNQDSPGATFSVRLPLKAKSRMKLISMVGGRA